MFYFCSMPAVYFVETDSYDSAWEKAIVPVVAVFSLVFGMLEPRKAWRWPLVIMGFHYASGVLMKHWGQLLPFELLYAGFLSIPGVAAAYLGAFLAKRLGKNAT